MNRQIAISKKLSFYLRHNLHETPETSKEGYVPIDVLLRKRDFDGVSQTDVEDIVRDNSKQRFALLVRGGMGDSGYGRNRGTAPGRGV